MAATRTTQEETTNESDVFSKKKKKNNLNLEYWMKVLEDEQECLQ
jgi:hypothetical protein